MKFDDKKINLMEFVPMRVICGKNFKEYALNIVDNERYLKLNYFTEIVNKSKVRVGKREYSLIIPKYIKRNNETFEVLGLLQAEMGKTQNGCLVFCNHECRLINKVMMWFEKELGIMPNDWKWYIKVNINAPKEKEYKERIEEKVVNYWLNKSPVSADMKHPKVVTYIKNTKNKKIRYYDYGTLIIEHKNNLFSQIIKRFVNYLSYNILKYSEKEIRGFIKGIIAGESNVEVDKLHKKFRIHITAMQKIERDHYQKCLARLGIESKQYKDYKALVISKKQNHLKLFQQKLMCLSPQKYNKFLRLLSLYGKFKELDEYKKDRIYPANKISQEVIDEIIRLHHLDPKAPAWNIAEKVGVSDIKVQRVRKGYNLGFKGL